ncbi:unnamed protein product [Darwinula stevensoni]|uniref:Uncharacterized protein n=1 Tax=Darwinula stevensoni TaxID=69355 RepID=A0A7R8XCC5_9CRUS|nr:unnamed protein product [Darwinula stevensoni]CAG0892414.1 unnamed protein product [Darwinula stevensoni]
MESIMYVSQALAFLGITEQNFQPFVKDCMENRSARGNNRLSSFVRVEGYYCTFNLCRGDQYCCGNNICCDNVFNLLDTGVAVLVFLFIILCAVLIRIFLFQGFRMFTDHMSQRFVPLRSSFNEEDTHALMDDMEDPPSVLGYQPMKDDPKGPPPPYSESLGHKSDHSV